MNAERRDVAARAPGSRAGSLRSKLLRLSISMAGVVVIVLAIGMSAAFLALRAVEQQDATLRLERARAFLSRQVRIRRDRTEEYAYWDEMWQRAGRPVGPATEVFFRENFVEWFPVRYGDDLIRIWGSADQVILEWQDSSAAVPEVPLAAALRLAVPSYPATGGFLWTPRGLVLYTGAAILRSEDVELRRNPQGYVLIAAFVHDSMIAQWGEELQNRLRLLPPDSAADELAVTRHVAGDSIESRFLLRDPFGRPAAVVAVTGSRDFISRVASVVYAAVGLAGLILALSVSLLWWQTDRLVSRPLSGITRELRSMPREGQLRELTVASPAGEWALFTSSFNTTVRALEASQGYYRALFDSAADGLVLLETSSGTILEANAAAERLLGARADQLQGRALPACMGLADQAVPEGMVRVHRPDGSTVLVSIITNRVEAGGMTGTLAALRDLTEREALRAQVREAHGQKMEAIGVLAGGVAHDFNNQLGTLLISIAALREETATASGRDIVDTIEQASRRAAELTRQLLRFARREPMHVEVLDPSDVIQGVERLCRRTFSPSVRLQTVIPEVRPVIAGDTGQLEQSLLNLCINARDAMPLGGTLRITLTEQRLDEHDARELDGLAPGAYAVIAVSDTGTGMSPEVMRRIFEPFYTTKPAGQGTGLGLAMVYGSMRAHGGGVRVHSVPGRGTRFELLLPASAASLPVTPAVTTVAAPDVGGCETVLLIDDEELFRRATAVALRRTGYTVLEARDGVQGIAAFAEHAASVNIVITDMAMPGAGGPEVFSAVREIAPAVPVLVCSGSPDGEDLLRLVEAGINGVLTKPFDASELAAAIRAALHDAPRRSAATAAT